LPQEISPATGDSTSTDVQPSPDLNIQSDNATNPQQSPSPSLVATSQDSAPPTPDSIISGSPPAPLPQETVQELNTPSSAIGNSTSTDAQLFPAFDIQSANATGSPQPSLFINATTLDLVNNGNAILLNNSTLHNGTVLNNTTSLVNNLHGL
jgi:hypothetical protein